MIFCWARLAEVGSQLKSDDDDDESVSGSLWCVREQFYWLSLLMFIRLSQHCILMGLAGFCFCCFKLFADFIICCYVTRVYVVHVHFVFHWKGRFSPNKLYFPSFFCSAVTFDVSSRNNVNSSFERWYIRANKVNLMFWSGFFLFLIWLLLR